MKLDKETVFHILIICLILIGGFFLKPKLLSSNETDTYAVVTKVIDGDTIIVEGGRDVRLLGIDADEKGYPCYGEAKKELEKMVLGKRVRLEKASQNKGPYGRYLRYIFLNHTNINLQLVKKGLVVTRFSSDYKFKEKLQKAEKYAKKNKIGCKWGGSNNWIKESNNFTDPCEAEKYDEKKINISGKISDFYESQNNNVFLNFGGKYPNHCFTAVIFSHSLDGFDINMDQLEGRRVRIEGKVEMFEGKPEIIIEDRSQVEVVG